MSTSSTMADSGSKIQDSEKKRRREKIVRLTLEILESEKDYQVLNILGCGTYGDVFQIYDSKRDIEIAAKIVTSDNISEMELSLWPKLNHPNIVPLLELFTLNLLDVIIFIMPLQYKTLHDLLFDTRFSKSRNSSFYVKRWFFEILCAISYMHEHEMCHLDIKVDNVLITHTFSAMLCDFSFLNETAKPLERYDLGLPYIYRPPEACISLGKSISLNGIAYDMWGYGVMVVEIFTHLSLAITIMDCKCWFKEVYPILFDMLQEDEFTTKLLQALPGINTKECEPSLALNFIHMFLKVDPFQRSSAEEAKQHVFLGSGSIICKADEIWKNKVEELVIVNRSDDDTGSDEPECSHKRNSQSTEGFDCEHNSRDGHSDIGLETESYCTEVFKAKAPTGTEDSDLFDSMEISTSYRADVSDSQSHANEESSEKTPAIVDTCLHEKESYQSNGLEGCGNDESVKSCTPSKRQQKLKISSSNIEIVPPKQSESGNPVKDPNLSSKQTEAKNNFKLSFPNKNKIQKVSQNTRKQKLKGVKAKHISRNKYKVKKLTKRHCVTQNEKQSKLDTQTNKSHKKSLELHDKTKLSEEASPCTEENAQESSKVIPKCILSNEIQAISDVRRYCKIARGLKFDCENFPDKVAHFSQPQKSLSAEFELDSGIEIKGATGDFQLPHLPSSAKRKEIDFSTDTICPDDSLLPELSATATVDGDKINSCQKNNDSSNEFEKYIRNLRLQVNQLDAMVRELEKKAICRSCAKSRHQKQNSKSDNSSIFAEEKLQIDNSSKPLENPVPGYTLLGNTSISNRVHFRNNLSSDATERHTSRQVLFEKTSITGIECSQNGNPSQSLDNFASANAGNQELSISNEEHSQSQISSKSIEESKYRQMFTEDMPDLDEEQPQGRLLSKLQYNFASKRAVSEETHSTDEEKQHLTSADSLKSENEFLSGNWFDDFEDKDWNWSNNFEDKDLILEDVKLQTESTHSGSSFMDGIKNKESQIVDPSISIIYSRHKRFMKWLRKKVLELERILKHRKYHLMK